VVDRPVAQEAAGGQPGVPGADNDGGEVFYRSARPEARFRMLS
jgi:hypothetical protein